MKINSQKNACQITIVFKGIEITTCEKYFTMGAMTLKLIQMAAWKDDINIEYAIAHISYHRCSLLPQKIRFHDD